MKKIILGSVTLLSLFLAGCSNQGSETNQTDQSIEKKQQLLLNHHNLIQILKN